MSYGMIAQVVALILYTLAFSFETGRRYAASIGEGKETI